jgi:hypothetical protein
LRTSLASELGLLSGACEGSRGGAGRPWRQDALAIFLIQPFRNISGGIACKFG